MKHLLITALLFLASFSYSNAQVSKPDGKPAGQELGDGMKDLGKGMKKAGKSIGKEGGKAGRKIGREGRQMKNDAKKPDKTSSN